MVEFKIVSICCKCKLEAHFSEPIMEICPYCKCKRWIYWQQPLIQDGCKKRKLAGVYIGR